MRKPDTRAGKARPRKLSPPVGGSTPGGAPGARGRREPKASPAVPPGAPGSRRSSASGDGGEVADLLRDVRAALDRLTEALGPRRAPEPGEAPELDQALIAIRRVIGEVLDHALEQVMGPLVGIRLALSRALQSAGASSGPDGDALGRAVESSAEELDRVLLRLGAESFRPVRGEYFDPLIHREAGETRQEGLEPGAIAEVLHPGFKTGRGRVIMPAAVTVNRG